MDNDPRVVFHTVDDTVGDVNKIFMISVTDTNTDETKAFISTNMCHNVNYSGFECSCCGAWLTDDNVINGYVNFCPNCGKPRDDLEDE